MTSPASLSWIFLTRTVRRTIRERVRKEKKTANTMKHRMKVRTQKQVRPRPGEESKEVHRGGNDTEGVVQVVNWEQEGTEHKKKHGISHEGQTTFPNYLHLIVASAPPTVPQCLAWYTHTLHAIAINLHLLQSSFCRQGRPYKYCPTLWLCLSSVAMALLPHMFTESVAIN